MVDGYDSKIRHYLARFKTKNKMLIQSQKIGTNYLFFKIENTRYFS